MSGSGTAVIILIFNVMFGVFWGITNYAYELDKNAGSPIVEYEISDEYTNVSVTEIAEYAKPESDYNVGILNQIIVVYLTISSIMAGYVLLNPVK